MNSAKETKKERDIEKYKRINYLSLKNYVYVYLCLNFFVFVQLFLRHTNVPQARSLLIAACQSRTSSMPIKFDPCK